MQETTRGKGEKVGSKAGSAQVLLVQADSRAMPLRDQSVHCIVTSPPYWALRDYSIGVDAGELGREDTHDCFGWATGQDCGTCYLCHMRAVARELWRVLRDDGTWWLNIADTYAGSWGAQSRPNGNDLKSTLQGGSMLSARQITAHPHGSYTGSRKRTPGLKNKDLCGIPWRLAFALQSDGWYLRSDIIWCLSGGTWLYARTNKGDMPITVKDLARLDPSTVRLWNGEKWTQLRGMSRSPRMSDEIEIVLRSGERLSCTPTHKFPTQRGLLEAQYLMLGDRLQRTILPEPECPRDSIHVGNDAAWFAGLYIAEGSRSEDTLQIAGHCKETERLKIVQGIAAAYGGSVAYSIDGNNMSIRVYGKMLNTIIDMLVTGKDAKTKGVNPICWRYSNEFLRALLDGYLSGDGHWDISNNRWRLNFTRNYNLERDLRTIAARLGIHLVLNMSSAKFKGQSWPTFRGELRFTRNGHHNECDTTEIVALQKARCREVYDLGVADEPHLFALASGILTHNSKPNPMPNSQQDRPTTSHEYIFLLTKQAQYFYDAEAIAEACVTGDNGSSFVSTYDLATKPGLGQGPRRKSEAFGQNGRNVQLTNNESQRRDEPGTCSNNPARRPNLMRTARDVWRIATEPCTLAHYATMPRALAAKCIAAGSSQHGVCRTCGAPWRRVLKRQRVLDGHIPVAGTFARPDEPFRIPPNGIGHGRYSTQTTEHGWTPTCCCLDTIPVPATILDPFCGSGTTLEAARALGRDSIGLDLSLPNLADIASERLGFKALAAWEHGAVPRPVTYDDLPLFRNALQST